MRKEKEVKEEAEEEVTSVEEGEKVKAIPGTVIEEKVKERTENQSSSEKEKGMEDMEIMRTETPPSIEETAGRLVMFHWMENQCILETIQTRK